MRCASPRNSSGRFRLPTKVSKSIHVLAADTIWFLVFSGSQSDMGSRLPLVLCAQKSKKYMVVDGKNLENSAAEAALKEIVEVSLAKKRVSKKTGS